MEKLTTKQLYNNAKRKGILFCNHDRELFRKYDYYQVINAYKSLFISSTENIDDIKNVINNNDEKEIKRLIKYYNIKKYKNLDDLFKKICIVICKKYQLNYHYNDDIEIMIAKIRKINYVHHIYDINTYYRDFVRMYEFESELRSCLLKYVLIIEENIKKVFISTLNDECVEANYLVDINNYMNSQDYNRSLESLDKVIRLYGNKNSKPISRKREQGLPVPYWIIINEMTLGQTITTIKNLNNDMKYKILQACINNFTLDNCNLFKANITKDEYKNSLDDIIKFSDILVTIGDFRNLLAHNQPIYLFNVSNTNLSSYPIINYDRPFMYKIKNLDISKQKAAKNENNIKYLLKMQNYFGKDLFNSRVNNVNIDLSWMIYVVNQIIKILRPNNLFKSELITIYQKYNIIKIYFDEELNDINYLKEFLIQYDSVNIKTELNQLKSELRNNNYGQSVRNCNNLISQINKLNQYFNKIEIRRNNSEYILFPRYNIYQKYTNISSNFLYSL